MLVRAIHTSVALCFLCSTWTSIQVSCNMMNRARLYNDLFQQYNKHIIPYPDNAGNEGLKVVHGLYLLRILDMKDQVLSVTAFTEMIWRDQRLQWDPTEYGGAQRIDVPSQLLWQPDLVLENSADEYKGYPSGDVHMRLLSDGELTYYVPATRMNTYCETDKPTQDIQPNDQVSCQLKFSSWSREKSSLSLELKSDHVLLGIFEDGFNADWTLITSSANITEEMYACCTYQHAVYSLTLGYRMNNSTETSSASNTWCGDGQKLLFVLMTSAIWTILY